MTRTRMGKENEKNIIPQTWTFFPCRFLKVLKKNNQLHVGMLLFILKGTPQQKGKDVSNPWLSPRVFCLPCC